jgi:hypothetical protein
MEKMKIAIINPVRTLGVKNLLILIYSVPAAGALTVYCKLMSLSARWFEPALPLTIIKVFEFYALATEYTFSMI